MSGQLVRTPQRLPQITNIYVSVLCQDRGATGLINFEKSKETAEIEEHEAPENRAWLENLLKKDDLKLQDGQFLLFWFYYASLILAVVLKFMGIQWGETDGGNFYLKAASASFVFIASLSLLWSATLPSLLKSINAQRQGLE